MPWIEAPAVEGGENVTIVRRSMYVPPSLEDSESTSIEPLKGRHAGSVCYIVGKGPSLANLRASDFGPGPVITINESIRFIEGLNLIDSRNPTYSMQKDGCMTADPGTIPRPCDTCHLFDFHREPVYNPRPEIAVVFAQYFSSWCLHGRDNRFVFTDAELGYEGEYETMSVLEAIPLAAHMGATSIVMVAFDSLTDGNVQTIGFVNGTDYTLDYQPNGEVQPLIAGDGDTMRRNLDWLKPRVLAKLDAFGPHSFLQPRGRA